VLLLLLLLLLLLRCRKSGVTVLLQIISHLKLLCFCFENYCVLRQQFNTRKDARNEHNPSTLQDLTFPETQRP
jgi:hypothetical protein